MDNGEHALASCPVIVSASRSTDIPAFYADWFVERIKRGYSAWINPFNGKKHYISYANTQFIVFWSKNPAPLLQHLPFLRARGIGCYIQFTLNDYGDNGLEPGVPPLDQRIETFKALAAALGRGSVVWRFDPLFLTADISVDVLLEKIGRIGMELHNYTEKLVFSFADILTYSRVRAQLHRLRIPYRDWQAEQMREFGARLVELNRAKGWHLSLATCAEPLRLPGIEPNRCVDAPLILRLSDSPDVWECLGAKPCAVPPLFGPPPAGALDLGSGRWAIVRKPRLDRGQRSACGCVESKDVGQYGTCPHLCVYCYANHSRDAALRNHGRHRANPWGELLTG